MNKLLIIVFLGLAATQILADTTVTEKWNVAPSLAINSTEESMKSRDMLASAITTLDNSTNTNLTTITLAVPTVVSQILQYAERTLLSSPNTAIQRSANNDSTKTLTGAGQILETAILTQNGDLTLAASTGGKATLFTVLAGEASSTSKDFSAPAGVSVDLVESYWNSSAPKVAYAGHTETTKEVYVASLTKSVSIYNSSLSTSAPRVDEATVYVTANVTVTTGLPENVVNQTTNTTYQSVATDTNTTTIFGVACADDLAINETDPVACYLSVSINSSTVTVNQTWNTITTVTNVTVTDPTTNATEIKTNTTTTTTPVVNTNVTNTTNYTLTSLLYVRVSLENQNVTSVKNLTGALVTEKTLLVGLKAVTKKDNTTILIYHVMDTVNETTGAEVIVAVKAINGDSVEPKTLKDLNNNKLRQVAMVSVETYFDGIALFHVEQDDNTTNTLYTTYKSDLTAIDTQKLVVGNTFFKTFKSSNSEIFGIYDSSVNGKDIDAVYVGKIFNTSFASSIQTVFGFAALFLAAVFAL